jgi:hypothetical protein
LAGCIAVALSERARDGAVASATKNRGGEVIAELIKFEMFLPAFDSIAREYGKQALREYVAAPPILRVPDENQIGELFEQALALLTKIAKTALN